MTHTGYTDMIVNTMLGWLKTLATWVLRFFNLYGGASPLDFLVKNWLKLLVILMVIGIVLDIVVWLLRWRPHWVWFGKKRVVITDKNFFARERYADEDEDEADRGKFKRPKRDWVDNDFVVKRRKKPIVVKEHPQTDLFSDEAFNVDDKHRLVDRYEDEVFNVEDLPVTAPEETPAEESAETPVDKTAETPVETSAETPAEEAVEPSAEHTGDAQ